MGDIHGFKKNKRTLPENEPIARRLQHFDEFVIPADQKLIHKQSSRCMDCGVPFCHSGCPLGNRIPEFNDAVHGDQWKKAYELLISTNNFPEFTGRICPAPCESACVLGINNNPVTIEFIEKSIIEKAFAEGWVKPKKSIHRTGKDISIVGSGPAGLAAADQLNRAGHNVIVYEKNIRPGGLLRYGIPDFKLSKSVIDRRLRILEAEGVKFVCNTEVGKDIAAETVLSESDAVLLCGGSSVPRDLNIEGRELEGIHFAMEFLEQNNKRIAGVQSGFSLFDLKDKRVVVIGGGDTGSDCIGTANRLGASEVIQVELLSKPGAQRTEKDPWPNWPMVLRTSTSHEEGCRREWALCTKRFVSNDGIHLNGIEVVEVEWMLDASGSPKVVEKEGSNQIIECDLVFLAMGFLHPKLQGVIKDLDLQLDEKRNVACNNYQSSVHKVFAAGDIRRGQSLVVWAIAEGREAAVSIDEFLMGSEAILSSNFRSPLEI